jgi:hypothetical protein
MSAARRSSGVLYADGRVSPASLSGLRRSSLPLVRFVAMDLMIQPKDCQPKRTSSDRDPPVCMTVPGPVAPIEVPAYGDFEG